MARSRLEKIGTIFDRVNGLLRTGAMKLEDKPLWYDVYEAFPPKLEPRYDRPAPNIPIKPIFYKEDVVRAKFQKEYKTLGTSNLNNFNTLTVTQKFLNIYKRVELENANKTQDEVYDEALNIFNIERVSLQQNVEVGNVVEGKSVNLKKSVNIDEIMSEK